MRKSGICAWILLVSNALLSDAIHGAEVFMLGDHVGYGVTRVQEESCFGIVPTWVAPSRETTLYAMQPGVYRLPAEVKHVFEEGVAIVRIGDEAMVCENEAWPTGDEVSLALSRTGIGSLIVGVGDGGHVEMHVRVEHIEGEEFFAISPVRETDRFVTGMVGSRVILEDAVAGLLISVDQASNRGRVIRQDVLTRLVDPFFASWTEAVKPPPESVVERGPIVKHRHFVGKLGWRNNPIIVGTRVFVGSAGKTKGISDPLDGLYSFDVESGEQIWFVHTSADFNDQTYVKGLVVGGTNDGEVIGVGARSGTTYWSRQLSGQILARPAWIREGVAIATSDGELSLLSPKDGATKVSSRLDGGVTGGLAMGRGQVWVATDAGTVHRFVGFGEVQMRRDSTVYYPDEAGNRLSGAAIEWYEILGSGRGLRARFDAAPLVLEDRVVLGMIREGVYDYPPVIGFKTSGDLDWIGTDPLRHVARKFGSAHITPVAWYNRIILADPESNSLYSISRETGEIVWASSLGVQNFQLWSSPVVEGDFVFIATYDGFLHKYRAENGERQWSLYLGREELAGRKFMGDELLPDPTANPGWSPGLSSPILSTPAISGDTIVVGTDEGFLYIIKDQ